MSRGLGKRFAAGASAALSVALVGVVAVLPQAAGATTKGHANANSGKTIQEWNWDTEADTPAEHAVLPAAISMFEKKYDVKVVNTSMTLTEQIDKLPLAFQSASSAPTVSQTNEGFGSMGRLVTDGELDNLSSYNKTYHWFTKVGSMPLEFNSFSSSGKQFGAGNVYGVPETGEIVGVFYNKKLITEAGGTVPTNWTTFTKDLALVKKHGTVPLAVSTGQPTSYQVIRDFYAIADRYVPAKEENDFVFHKGKPSVDTSGFVKAATTLDQWAKEGYFPPGYQGLSDSQAIAEFTSGKAAFFITGNWYAGTVESALGTSAGFWVPTEATGGPGEGWSIPKDSSNPKLAAEWISTMLSPTIQADLMKQGAIPVVKPSASALSKASPLVVSATNGWAKATKGHKLVAYLDWSTPDFLTQETAAIGELLAGKTTPSAMMQSLQSDYTTYWSSQS